MHAGIYGQAEIQVVDCVHVFLSTRSQGVTWLIADVL